MRRLTIREQTVITLSIGFAAVQIITAASISWISYTLLERDVRGYLSREAGELVREQFLILDGTLSYTTDAEGDSVTDRLRKRGISTLVITPDGLVRNVFGIYRTFITEGDDARNITGIRDALGLSESSFSHLTLSTNEQFETYTFPLVFQGQQMAIVQVAREERSLSDIVGSSSLILFALIPLSIFVGVLLSFWIVRRALAPLEQLYGAVHRIPDGVFPDQIPVIRNAQPEYTVLARAMNKLLASLAGIVNRHKEFIGNVAHELRTPLTKAISAVDVMLVKEKPMTDSTRIALQAIQDDLLGVSDTIGGLLSVSRLYESDPGNSTESDLLKAVHAVIKEYDDSIVRNQLRVLIDIPDDQKVPLPPAITKAIVGNILSNAVKYTPAGGMIRIRSHSTIHEVRVIVSDTGIGMSQEAVARIFERRYRGTARASGNGVGMALVKRIAGLWRMGIDVVSKEGNGTTVTLSIKKWHTNQVIG